MGVVHGPLSAVRRNHGAGARVSVATEDRDELMGTTGRSSGYLAATIDCVEFHREGGVAPFALETYEQVVSYAGMIRKQVNEGVMPPWFAAPSHAGGSGWANDRSLPAADKAALLAWLAGDKNAGDPADAPTARVYPKEWEIGTPDAVVRIPTPIDA